MSMIYYILAALLMVAVSSTGSANEEKDLADDLIDIIEPLKFTDLGKYIETPQAEIPEALEKISDSEMTRMIAAYLFTREGENPFTDHVIRRLLLAYPSLIQDDAEFRRLLIQEKDARRVHLLCANLMGRVSVDKNSDYIKEIAPMLMRDEPVGKAGGDYDSPVWHDVSIGTYNRILKQLRSANAPFKEADSDLRHEEKKLILARWLKENWPGCESLVIPDNSGNEKSPADNNTQVYTGERPKKPTATDPLPEAGETNTIRYLLGGMVMLIAMAAAWCVLRRQKAR